MTRGSLGRSVLKLTLHSAGLAHDAEQDAHVNSHQESYGTEQDRGICLNKGKYKRQHDGQRRPRTGAVQLCPRSPESSAFETTFRSSSFVAELDCCALGAATEVIPGSRRDFCRL